MLPQLELALLFWDTSSPVIFWTFSDIKRVCLLFSSIEVFGQEVSFVYNFLAKSQLNQKSLEAEEYRLQSLAMDEAVSVPVYKPLPRCEK